MTASFPRHIRVLLAAHFAATLMHFVHNAEYIAVYPSMPAWLTREQVCLAWLAVSGVGLAGLIVSRFQVIAGIALALASALLPGRSIARAHDG